MISVIIPIYNGEKYIKSLIKMLDKQTYQDFEVILIDDGSTDNSADLIRDMIRGNSRYRFYSNCNNGVSWTRNFGIEKSKGDYVIFIDCDDYINEDYLEKLSLHCHIGVDAVFCNVDIVDINLNVIKSQYIEEGIYTNSQMLLKLLDFKNVSTGPCGKLIKKKLLGNNLRFKGIKVYEDLVFNIDVLYKNQNFNIFFTNDISYKYVQYTDNSTMSNFNKKPSSDVITAMEYALQTIQNIGEYDYFFSRVLSQIMMYAINCDTNNKHFIKETKSFLKRHFIELLKNKNINKNEKILFIIYAFSFSFFHFIRRNI